MNQSWRRWAAGLLVLVLTSPLTGCGYNTLQETDEETTASWSEVLNQYQRRADLVPNLVNAVKGYADHEKTVLESVAAARSRVSGIQVSPELVNDEQAFKQFVSAQQELQGALSRLLMVAEQYPQLKADQGFRDLQAQLEGTENRITVARNRYIQAVKNYNLVVRSFPSNFTARWFDFKVKPNFGVDNEAALAKPPVVDFGTPPASQP